MLIEAGANVKNVQARLGHTNIAATLQTYVHDTEKMCDNPLLCLNRQPPENCHNYKKVESADCSVIQPFSFVQYQF